VIKINSLRCQLAFDFFEKNLHNRRFMNGQRVPKSQSPRQHRTVPPYTVCAYKISTTYTYSRDFIFPPKRANSVEGIALMFDYDGGLIDGTRRR
jgi:hypothetical protein